MEQVQNSVTLDILQTIAAQNQLPRTGGKTDGGSDFQKMMDKAAADSKDARTEDAPKDGTASPEKTEKAAQKDGPAQEEDPVETSRKAQIVVVGQVQPELMGAPVTLQAPETGEEITVLTGGSWKGQVWAEVVTPEEIAANPEAVGEGMKVIDVSDPEADAMLEFTDPTVDHSPAAMLEKVTAEQFGKTVEDAVETVRPEVEARAEVGVGVEVEAEEQNDDPLMEIIDAGQAPQPLFHDVKAAPVKVGEVYDAPETAEASVVRQVDAGVAQALEKGESLVRIQLNPENLGSVTVEITRTAEGVIHVALSAHSGETRNLLERHAGELQGLLGSRTQQSVEVNVQRQQESQQSQNRNQNYDGHNGHAQDGGQHRRNQQEQAGGQDFIQQLRLGLIPVDGDE